MSKATNRVKIIPIPPPPPSEVEVTLVLTDEEAQFLTDILASVGGSSKTSRRKYQDSISGALCAIGYEFTALNSPERDTSGSIHCHDSHEQCLKALERRASI